MGSLLRVPVQLKGIFWGSNSRWFLRGAEVWLGNEFLGEVSAEWLADQVAQHLARLASAKGLELELEPHRRGLPAEAPPPLSKATRRTARRKRRTAL